MAKNKVVLIRPNNIFNHAGYPPLSLLALGAVLKKNKYEVRVVDASQDRNVKEILKKEGKNAIAFGMTSYTSEVRNGIELTDFLKK